LINGGISNLFRLDRQPARENLYYFENINQVKENQAIAIRIIMKRTTETLATVHPNFQSKIPFLCVCSINSLLGE
jgi:hypothetical protein